MKEVKFAIHLIHILVCCLHWRTETSPMNVAISGSQIHFIIETSNVSVDEIPDFVLTVILSMLTTADLLKAMVLTSSFTRVPLTF